MTQEGKAPAAFIKFFVPLVLLQNFTMFLYLLKQNVGSSECTVFQKMQKYKLLLNANSTKTYSIYYNSKIICASTAELCSYQLGITQHELHTPEFLMSELSLFG